MSIYGYDEEQQRRWDKEEGEEIGMEKGLELAKRLLQDGRTEELLKATEDKDYRELLYKEYNL